MSRAYLRYSPKTFHDKVVVDGYPPAAFAAFNAVLCLAEEQPERGRFRSERLLRLLLDEPEEGVRLGWGKWVRYLIDHGDLVKQDGRLYVAGWDEWQEGDFTVAERVARLRKKRRDDNGAATPDVTAPEVITPSEAVSRRPKAVSGRQSPTPDVADGPTPPDAIDAYYRLTVSFPAGKVMAWLEELIAGFGDAAVERALGAEAAISTDRRTLLSRTQDRLRAEEHEASKQREADQAARAAKEKAMIETMPEERRAANLERLGDMMRASGLLGSKP